MCIRDRSPIDAFYNSVLLGLTNQHLVPSYVIDSAKLSEFRLTELKTVIGLELLDRFPGLVLYKRALNFLNVKNVSFFCLNK